eukprot:Opistho-2@40764
MMNVSCGASMQTLLSAPSYVETRAARTACGCAQSDSSKTSPSDTRCTPSRAKRSAILFLLAQQSVSKVVVGTGNIQQRDYGTRHKNSHDLLQTKKHTLSICGIHIRRSKRSNIVPMYSALI